MNDLKLAEYMHDKYEEFAAGSNWATQKKCRVPFSKLPKANQETMIALAKNLNERFNAQEIIATNWIAKVSNQNIEQKKAIELFLTIMPREHLITAMAELHDKRARDRFK